MFYLSPRPPLSPTVSPLLPFAHRFQALTVSWALGVLAIAVASGLCSGALFGPGPRDGLMTGLHARLGAPMWLCRLTVEGTVLVLGWWLGGTVGVGTIVFAMCIGPLVHIALPLFRIPVTDARSMLPMVALRMR